MYDYKSLMNYPDTMKRVLCCSSTLMTIIAETIYFKFKHCYSSLVKKKNGKFHYYISFLVKSREAYCAKNISKLNSVPLSRHGYPFLIFY